MAAPVWVIDGRNTYTFAAGGSVYEFVVPDINSNMGKSFALLVKKQEVTLVKFAKTNGMRVPKLGPRAPRYTNPGEPVAVLHEPTAIETPAWRITSVVITGADEFRCIKGCTHATSG